MFRSVLLRVAVLVALALPLVIPTPAAAASAQESVAYIGGSVTGLPVQGYHNLVRNGNVLWPPYNIGGGTLTSWNRTRGKFWPNFDSLLAAKPPVESVWWMLTQHDAEGLDPAYLRSLADSLLVDLRHRTNAPVYVSVMADYPDHTCPSIDRAPAALAALAEDLIAEGLVLRGPVMAPLTADLVVPAPDGCHQNDKGQLVHGRQLRRFFE